MVRPNGELILVKGLKFHIAGNVSMWVLGKMILSDGLQGGRDEGILDLQNYIYVVSTETVLGHKVGCIHTDGWTD